MTRKENITAILECHFTGFKQEIIDSAVDRISALSEKDWKFYYDHGYAQAKRDLFVNKGDLISRQAVLDTLDNMNKALDEDRTVEKYKELLMECIEVLPSAELRKVWRERKESDVE